MDADFAAETANLSRAQILQEAGTAMVAQANQLPQTVLALLGFSERRVAVECNGEIVPRSHHARTVVADGDQLEVVHAIGGG